MAAKTVVAVFRSEQQAEKAVRELRSKGFSDNEISVIGPDRRRQERRDEARFGNQSLSEGATWGAGIGGAAGLLAGAGALAIPGFGPLLAMGPLAATLTAAAGGSIAGSLVDFGIPEREGRELEERIRRGEFLCVVKTERNAEEAERILRDCGGENVRIHPAA